MLVYIFPEISLLEVVSSTGSTAENKRKMQELV